MYLAFFTEMRGRFSFYGMKTLLLYLTLTQHRFAGFARRLRRVGVLRAGGPIQTGQVGRRPAARRTVLHALGLSRPAIGQQRRSDERVVTA